MDVADCWKVSKYPSRFHRSYLRFAVSLRHISFLMIGSLVMPESISIFSDRQPHLCQVSFAYTVQRISTSERTLIIGIFTSTHAIAHYCKEEGTTKWPECPLEVKMVLVFFAQYPCLQSTKVYCTSYGHVCINQWPFCIITRGIKWTAWWVGGALDGGRARSTYQVHAAVAQVQMWLLHGCCMTFLLALCCHCQIKWKKKTKLKQ